MKESHSGKKVLALVTGGISVLIAIVYLILIMVLDARGSMLPPPPEAFGVELIAFDESSLVAQPLYEWLFQ